MVHLAADVLGAIGTTPLVELRKIVPAGSARIVAKLESANPTGSMKDRMARAAIDAAEADGRLRPGGTVVEYTAGTTGVSLALVCAAKGYPLEIVFSDAFSEEKALTMRAFGANLTIVPSDNKKITEALIKEMIETARQISSRPGAFWTDQLNNHDAISGYHALGEELWTQTGGQLDAFTPSARPTPFTALRVLCGATSALFTWRPWNPPSPPYCPAAHRDRTKSKALGLASFPRCGIRTRSMKSSASRLMKRRRWRDASLERKAFLLVRQLARMSSPRCGLRRASARRPSSPQSSSTRASATSLPMYSGRRKGNRVVAEAFPPVSQGRQPRQQCGVVSPSEFP